MSANKTIIPNISGYRLFDVLGKGAFGSVYRAEQQSTGQTVAIKLLHVEKNEYSSHSERKTARFKREAEIASNLQHPNIVKLIETGKTEANSLFVVYEYVAGDTLQTLIRQQGPMPAAKAGQLMAQVLDALAYAHSSGIVHRDLKPGNLIVNFTRTQPYVKVLDFGIGGLLMDYRGADYSSLTNTNEALGTPSYAAPEQLRGEPPNTKSDLYAWGLTFLECLTGRVVISGKTVADILHKQLSSTEISLPPGIASHPLSSLLRRILKKNPKERMGDAAQLWTQLTSLHLNDLLVDLSVLQEPGDEIDFRTKTSWDLQAATERHRVTVLCFSLSLAPLSGEIPDLETMNSLYRNQQNLCIDIAAKYGGTLAGSLGDITMLFFGYHSPSGSDARCAARTALELSEISRRQSTQLKVKLGIGLEFRAGIHSGIIRIDDSSSPSGPVPNMALRLERASPQGVTLANIETMQLLKKHFEFEKTHPVGTRFFSKDGVYVLKGERRQEAKSFGFGTRLSDKLIGRKHEIIILTEALKSASSGKGKIIMLQGEAGVGKSRLLRAFWDQCRKTPHIYREVQFLPEYRNSALQPILDTLKFEMHLNKYKNSKNAVVQIKNTLLGCGCNVDVLLPIFCAWFSLPLPKKCAPLQHAPQQQKKMLFDAAIQLLFKKKGCHVLVMEDIHWADPTSLEFLGKVFTFIQKKSHLLILSSRPDFVSPWPEHTANHVEISNLSKNESKDLIGQCLNGVPMQSATKNRIIERAGGNPLFIKELINLITEQGAENHYNIYQGPGPDFIPGSLLELLSARLHRLGPSRDTAEIAAVIGVEFDYSLLAKISPLDERGLCSHIDTLLAYEIIFLKRGIQSCTYEFRHALFRDVAYENMLPGVRKKKHADIAKKLEAGLRRKAKDLSYIAYHFAGAEEYAKAVEFGTKAAQKSLNQAANSETIYHSKIVLDCIKKLDPEKAIEAELRINGIMTQALMGLHGWADDAVKTQIDRFNYLLKQTKNSGYVVQTMWSLMTYHYVVSNRRELRRVTEELMQQAEYTRDRYLQVAAETFMGLTCHGEGRYPEAGKAFENVRKLYDTHYDTDHGSKFGLDSLVWSTTTLALVEWFMGDSPKADSYAHEAVAWARELNHVPSLCIALLYHANLCHYKGDINLAVKIIKELLNLANKYGLAAYQGYGQIMDYWVKGDVQGAERVLNKLEGMGCRAALPYYRSLIANILARDNNYDDALKCMNQCLHLCKLNHENYYTPELNRLCGDFFLKQDPPQVALAEDSFRKAIDKAKQQHMIRTEVRGLKALSKIKKAGMKRCDQKRLEEILSVYPTITDY